MPRARISRRWRTGQGGRTIHAQLGSEPSGADPLIGVMDTPELAESTVKAHNRLPEVDPAERWWNDAIDWLINSRHTADPDIQDTFWGIANGTCTRAEAETISVETLRRRARRAGEDLA